MNSQPVIAFLTALPLEFDTVVVHLEERHSETAEGRKYTVGEKNGWKIVVRQQQAQGNYQAAIEANWLIHDYQPSYTFFVGVAGGIKDIALGDVVAADLVRGYESVKVKDEKVYPRLHVEHAANILKELAFELAKGKINPNIWVKPIASGEKLASDQTFLDELKRQCSDAVAVEMEAIGFLGSIRAHEAKGIVIRGISDLVVGKNEQDDGYWQPQAAKNAAAFAFEMVAELELSDIISDLPKNLSNLPARNMYFTGREKILAQLPALLAQKRVVALYGLSGVGKTQTALQYAYVHYQDYSRVLWVTAETERDFKHSLVALASFLEVSTEDKSEAEVIAQVKQWLQAHTGWLLLIDNVEHLTKAPVKPGKKTVWTWLKIGWCKLLPWFCHQPKNELLVIRDFLGEVREKGSILLTTLLPSTRPVAEPVELGKMAVKEGINMLFQYTLGLETGGEQHEDYEAAKKLVYAMDGLPLALEQAAVYIHATHSDFEEYLRLYKENERQFLEEWESPLHNQLHSRSLAITLRILFKKIGKHHSKSALDLLFFCAFLPADGIPENVLLQLFDLDDYSQLSELLKPALNYSLLKRDVKNKQLRMHRLVQTVLKLDLATSEQRRHMSRIVTAVADIFPAPDEIENWPVIKALRPLV